MAEYTPTTEQVRAEHQITITDDIVAEARAEAEKRYAGSGLCQDAQLGYVDGYLAAMIRRLP